MKKLILVCAVLLLVGCVTQKPERVYTLNIFIEVAHNSITVKTDAKIDRDEAITTRQEVSPETDVSVIP